MSAIGQHTWVGYEKLRNQTRNFMILQLGCDIQTFGCDLVDFHDRSGLDVVADAIALSALLAEMATSFEESVNLTRFFPGYVEDSRFRRRVDQLVMDYLDADRDQKFECFNNLWIYCQRNGGPTTINVQPVASSLESPVNLVCEAVALLGGLHKAAAMIGVPVSTLQSWAMGEPLTMTNKLDLLFKLAGITVNPDRIGVQFIRPGQPPAAGPYVL